jgi:hypothetical protein
MARGDGGILDPNVHEAFIRDYARRRGLNPDLIAQLAAAEGLNAWSQSNPNAGNNPSLSGGRSISFGDFQLNVAKGLGQTARQYGIDPTNPNQWQAADKFAIDYLASTHDMTPWQSNRVAKAYLARYGPGNPSAFASTSGVNFAYSPQGGPSEQEVAQARAYLRSLSEHQDRPGDTDNLAPLFAVRLAGALHDANNQGMRLTLASGFRTPDQTGSAYDAEGKSLHSYGGAADIGGFTPGSPEAKRWYDIAMTHGIYNPYGWQHPKEYNHYQFLPSPLETNPDLLAKLKAAPNKETQWALLTGGTSGDGAPAAGAVVAGGAGNPLMPAPLTPLQQIGMSLGSALGSGQLFGGGGEGGIEDTPDPPPIRTLALQGFQALPQPDYLGGRQAADALGTLGAQPWASDLPGSEGITAGAPSMTGMALGVGTPMTGVGAESPLTYPSAMARYSRMG